MIQDNNIFLHCADSRACSFWSHFISDKYGSRNGVALFFNGAHPFQDLQEEPTLFGHMDILRNRYLVVSAKLGHLRIYFHVVYGPVQPGDRSAFYLALPRIFDDSTVHLVLQDFNTTMDPDLDQATPRLIDFWRLENPDKLKFTGPKSKNRIDYCLASIDFYDKFICSSGHVLDTNLVARTTFLLNFQPHPLILRLVIP
ncbi:unnamed protein product [Peronospora destructor]|uniref:Uncharacterized protein n=1 Tax=Peronospora destructor TaxID=86335 RepID=A0AAV0T6Z1_9STRA|nr:unnamed protein product [Peronospora destructor]